MKDSLTARQTKFVAEYLIDLNATQAAIRAGYSAKTAQEQSSRLLSNVMVGAAIANGQARQLEKADLTAARVLEQIRRGACFDIRQLFDAQGRFRPLHELSEDEAFCVAGVDEVRGNEDKGGGHFDRVLRIRFVDRVRYVEMAARYHGLLVDRVKVENDTSLRQRVAAARRRLAELNRAD